MKTFNQFLAEAQSRIAQIAARGTGMPQRSIEKRNPHAWMSASRHEPQPTMKKGEKRELHFIYAKGKSHSGQQTYKVHKHVEVAEKDGHPRRMAHHMTDVHAKHEKDGWMYHDAAHTPEEAAKKLKKYREQNAAWAAERGKRLTESEDQLGLHGSTHEINTDHFEGKAHVEFERVKRGKHQQHQYKVTYKGKGGHPKHGGKNEDHEHTSFMDVDHSHGRPYRYRDYPHSSKDLSTLLHKAAPRWVSLEDLK